MRKIFVQFADASASKVVAVFGCPQDAAVYPHQGEVDPSDPRYLVFTDPAALLSGLDRTKADLAAAATARRWEVETGGITLPNGVRVGSAREDQNAIANAVGVIDLTGMDEIDFKADSGWVRLNKTELEAIAAAVGRHKQACYSAERAHHEAIVALQTEAAVAGYSIATGWPSGA